MRTSNLLTNIKLYIQIHWRRLLVSSLVGLILSTSAILSEGILFQIPLQNYTSSYPTNLSAISITCIVIGSLGLFLFILPLVISVTYFIIKWKREHRNPFSVHTTTHNQEEDEEENYLYSSSSTSSSTQPSPTSYYQSHSATPVSTLSDEQNKKSKTQKKRTASVGMRVPSSSTSIAQETYDAVKDLEMEEKYQAITSLALIPMVSSVLLLLTTVLTSILGFILFWVSFALFFPGKDPEVVVTSQQNIATMLALFSLLPLLLWCPLLGCVSLIPIDIRKSLFRTSS